METRDKLLISASCIKKYYPNDIGAINILKAIVLNHNIKAAKKIESKKRFDLKLPTKRKVAYYPLDKIESVMLKQELNLVSQDSVSRTRLREVINKIKKGE